MRNILKQFGARATASFSERFNRSIVRLTLFYSLTLACLLTVSCLVSYSAFSHRIVHRFHPVPAIVIQLGPSVDTALPFGTPTPEQLREDLLASLLLVNLSLLGLAIILSYWLARKTLAPIKRAYEAQERFLSDVSHELRTPIAILQIDLENELLHSPDRTPAIVSKLEEVHNMGTLVNDILTLSRMDHAGRKEVRTFVAIALRPLVNAICTRLQPLATAHDVMLSIQQDTPKDTPDICLPVDHDRLSRALTNVVKNAIIYNKPRGTVTVTIRQKDGTTAIDVADTGIGIDTEDIGHIFDRFYRVDESRARQSGGTGLGLSIVQSAVQGMGGTIDIASEIGSGTTVTITFRT